VTTAPYEHILHTREIAASFAALLSSGVQVFLRACQPAG